MKFYRNIIVILASGVLTALSVSCSSQVSAGRSEKVYGKGGRTTFGSGTDVTTIEAGLCVEVEYVQDAGKRGTTVEMSCDRAPLSWWKAGIDGNKLTINTSDQWPSQVEDAPVLKVKVTGRELHEVGLSVTGRFTMTNYTSDHSLKLTGQSATSFDIGNISLGGQAQLWIEPNGATDVKIANIIAQSLKVSASGGTTVGIDHLSGGSATIVGNGAADINVGDIALNALTASSSGAATVTVEGRSNAATLSASGASEVNARQLRVADRLSISESGASSVHISSETGKVSRTGSRINVSDSEKQKVIVIPEEETEQSLEIVKP